MFYLRKCIEEKKPLLAMLLNILTWPRKNEFQEATNSIGYGDKHTHILPKWSWDPLGSCISHIYQNLDYTQAQQEQLATNFKSKIVDLCKIACVIILRKPKSII